MECRNTLSRFLKTGVKLRNAFLVAALGSAERLWRPGCKKLALMPLKLTAVSQMRWASPVEDAAVLVNGGVARQGFCGVYFAEGLQLNAGQAPTVQGDPALVTAVSLGRKLKPVPSLPAPTLPRIAHRAQAAENRALIEKLQILVVQVLARQCNGIAAQVGMVCPNCGKYCKGGKKKQQRDRHRSPGRKVMWQYTKLTCVLQVAIRWCYRITKNKKSRSSELTGLLSGTRSKKMVD